MSENYRTLTDLVQSGLGGAGLTLVGAIAGRLMWIGGQVRKGLRRFWTIDLIWELPIVFGMAFIGEGLSSWLDVSASASTAIIAGLSYLGPRGAEVLFTNWLGKRFGDKNGCK